MVLFKLSEYVCSVYKYTQGNLVHQSQLYVVPSSSSDPDIAEISLPGSGVTLSSGMLLCISKDIWYFTTRTRMVSTLVSVYAHWVFHTAVSIVKHRAAEAARQRQRGSVCACVCVCEWV